MPALRKFEGRASIAGGVPSAVVDEGAFARSLAEIGNGLSTSLGALADKAAASAGELAGLNAGSRAGAGFIARRAIDTAASTRAVSMGDVDATIEAAAKKYGVNADALKSIAWIESRGDPKAKNKATSAGGLFQFVDGTAAQYGLADRFDAAQSADAAARLLKDNTATLRQALGREPTPAELYLAHQQGGKGAAGLLANPDASAASIVGADAVVLNGGTAGMTSGDFADLWLKRAGGGAPAMSAPAPAQGDSLSTVPLALRHDGTIRGEAFDAAATRAWSWRMQLGLSTDLGQAAIDNADNPQGYEQAAGKIRTKYLAEGHIEDPRQRELFDAQFAERTASDRLQLATQHEAKLRLAETSSALDAIDAGRADLERQAYNLGANPAGDELLQKQAARQASAIAEAVSSNVLTPAQGSAATAQVLEGVARGRIQGVFAALDSPSKKEAYALGLMEEWASGKGSIAKLDLSQVKAMSAELFAAARSDANAQTATDKADLARFEQVAADDVASLAATGQGADIGDVDLGRMRELMGPVKTQEWTSKRDHARQLWEATNGMELESPAELNARLTALKPKPGSADFEAQQAIYGDALEKRNTLLEERKTDPLGQAARGGLVPLAPIDFTSPETLGPSLAARANDARTVAREYGTPVTLFRPEERQALATSLLEQPALIATFGLEAQKALGDLAPRALGELSEAGPEIAFSAGLQITTGDGSVAADVARTLSAKQQQLFKAKMPSDGAMSEAAGAILGDVLGQNDTARAGVLGTASLLFEKDLNAMGFAGDGVGKPGTPARAALERAIDRSLGSRTIEGVKYGGIATVNGGQIVAPPTMPATRPQELLQSLTDSQIAQLPPIASGNGFPVTAAQLQDATLVTVGNGLYRVALGDPAGLDPRYVAAEGGGFWILDMNRLAGLTRSQAPLQSGAGGGF